MPTGVVTRTDESDNLPPSVAMSRTLTYLGLSAVADVCVTERPDGTFNLVFQGKLRGIEPAGS
jgi:hypothetical protein